MRSQHSTGTRWRSLKASSTKLTTSQDDRVILANRRYVKSLAEVVILCAKQNIAFRGHDESEDSSNPGNFRAIVEILSRHDQDLKRRMEVLPACVNYKSPEIQNELIELLHGKHD